MNHARLPNSTAALNSNNGFAESEFVRSLFLKRHLRQEREAGCCGRPTKRVKHGTIQNRLGCGNGSVRITHQAPGDEAAFDNHLWFHAKERWSPRYQIGQLSWFDRADVLGYSVRDRRIDRVLGHIAFDTVVIIPLGVLGERAALDSHLMSRLPGTCDDFTYAPHCLGVTRKHAEDTLIMENIFGGHGLWTNATLSKRDIFRYQGIQMMTHH
jgi:hypothetical protein